MSGLIETATENYGGTLANAHKHELIGIFGAIALELECRHPNMLTKTLEQVHSMATEASDEDLLTLAIAVAIRLRTPNMPIALIPAVSHRAA